MFALPGKYFYIFRTSSTMYAQKIGQRKIARYTKKHLSKREVFFA